MAGYDYAKFCQAVAALHGHDCYVRWVVSCRPLAIPSNWEVCDGQMDAHHVAVPKRMLKSGFPNGVRCIYRPSWPLTASDDLVAGVATIERIAAEPRDWTRTLGDLLNDGRNGIPACRHHHDLVENRIIKLVRSELPSQAEEFAQELGLGWWLDRDFGAC